MTDNADTVILPPFPNSCDDGGFFRTFEDEVVYVKEVDGRFFVYEIDHETITPADYKGIAVMDGDREIVSIHYY